MSLIKEEKGTFRITNFMPLTTIVVMVNEKHSICTESHKIH